jgi:hypothetical protein
MTSKKKQTTALALTGALALASGAYALGSQSDGNAVAAGEGQDRGPVLMHRGGRGPGPAGFGLERLADRLSVEASELREALEDVRGTVDPRADRRDAFAKELAAELNTTQAKVEAALERIRETQEAEFEKRHDAMAEALAKRLNLDAAKVKEALEAPRLFRRP